MNIRGPVGGDVNYTPIQKRLSPPLPKETLNATTPDNIVSKPVINDDQFITADIGNSVVVNSALLPKTEKKNNNDDVDDAWSTFAVKVETTNANAVLPPVLNAKQGVALQLTKPPEGKEPVVIAEFMKLAGTNETNGSNAAIIIDGLA